MTTNHRRLESMFAALATWVYAHRFSAVVTMLLLTVALAGQLPKLTIDTR